MDNPAIGAVQAPTVTIVGRPNVGKSSLLNFLARQRISIVDPTSGVTRDRVSALIQHRDRVFELVDTGGMGAPPSMELAAEMEAQIRIALATADLVLLVVDAKEGVTPLDESVARSVRTMNKPVILVVNKVDGARDALSVPAFEKLGFGEPSSTSTVQSTGRTDLLDRIIRTLPPVAAMAAPAADLPRLAVVGRQNVGKSTLINTLAHEERVIVSERPGTTRDSIDVVFEAGGRRFVAIDTAGLKKKKKARDSIEFYSLCRAERAVRRCDVALLLLDASAETSRVDKHLAQYIVDQAKPCAIVVNKWDLAEARGISPQAYVEYIRETLPGLAYAPISFICAKTGKNVIETVQLADELFRQAKRHVSTADVNRVIQKAQDARAPRRRKNKQPKIFYGTQVRSAPPTFLLYASHPKLIDEAYARYLMGTFQKRLGFPEVPVRIYFKARPRGRDGGG